MYKNEKRRQRGRVVRAPDLKSGHPEFKSHQLEFFQVVRAWFNSSAALVPSQLVCLLPVGILNLLSLFQWFISLALKSPNGERSIKYTFKNAHEKRAKLLFFHFWIGKLETFLSLSCLSHLVSFTWSCLNFFVKPLQNLLYSFIFEIRTRNVPWCPFPFFVCRDFIKTRWLQMWFFP